MAFSGPYVESTFLNTSPRFERRRERYRQNAPYVARLPYLMTDKREVPVTNPWDFTASSLPGLNVNVGDFPDALNGAFAKFTQAAKETANMAVNLAERKQAIDMMAKRITQIVKFARDLRALRFSEALGTLGLEILEKKDSRRSMRFRVRTPDGGLRDVKFRWNKLKETRKKKFKRVTPESTTKNLTKSFGNNFLEVHFGWEPLVKDIGSVIAMIHEPLGNLKVVKGRATITSSRPATPSVSDFDIVISGYWPKASVQIIADVAVTDPNLYRLNQLGFVNPAVIAWELVPFSFVVDWFTTVGQVLEAYTTFVGMSLVNPATTLFAKYEDTAYYRNGPQGSWDRPYVTLPIYTRIGLVTKRIQSIPMPTIAMKPGKLPSVIRGLTAISLLTQFLGKR